MEFISQTSADENGNYTTTWKNSNGEIVIIERNLFDV
jgi:hypothetical protein